MIQVVFRVWNINTSKMTAGFIMQTEDEQKLTYEFMLLLNLNIDNPTSIVMRSHGLQDMNGVTVYEGDVLAAHGTLWEVTSPDGDFSGWMMIGNKWANPELIS